MASFVKSTVATEIKKRVKFAFDNDCLMKPKPAYIAVYKKMSGVLIESIKSASQLESEERLELQSIKRSIKAWRPRRSTHTEIQLSKEEDESKAFATLEFNPLNINNLSGDWEGGVAQYLELDDGYPSINNLSEEDDGVSQYLEIDGGYPKDM